MNEIIMPLVRQGQSIHQIYIEHENELMCSEKTIYNYIDACLFDVRNIDLPRKVRFRERYKKPEYEINESGIMVLCKACDRYIELLRNDSQHPDHYPNQNGQDTNKLIIDFCREPRSVQEIMDKFDFDSRTSFRRKFLAPMLKKGELKMTIPEKPSSKNQKYFS